MMISFLGVRTDRQEFGILIWKHVGTQKISTLSSKLRVAKYFTSSGPLFFVNNSLTNSLITGKF